MNITKLASFIASKEGLKKQVTIGNAREILAILSDQLFVEFEALGYVAIPKVPSLKALYLNGKKRAKRKIK